MDDATDPFASINDGQQSSNNKTSDTDDGDVWDPIIPAPCDLPEVIHHWEYGPPTHRWIYRDATGAILFATVRFQFARPDGQLEKVILPCTYGRKSWRITKGSKAGKSGISTDWHYKRPPPPALTLRSQSGWRRVPIALVLITEGEKALMQRRRLCAGRICSTSQGGAKAAGTADWSPLANRHVVIWPDNDPPGDGYAADVARLVSEAGAASVRVVATPPDWPEGWDLADELPPGATVEQLIQLLEAAEASPRVEMPDGFSFSRAGLFYRPAPDTDWVFVAAPFDVVSEASDGSGNAWALVLKWCDRDGRRHRWSCPKRLAHADGSAIASALEDAGLTCGTSSKSHDALKQSIHWSVRSSRRLPAAWTAPGLAPRLTDAGYGFVVPGGEALGRAGRDLTLQHGANVPVLALHSALRRTLESWQRE